MNTEQRQQTIQSLVNQGIARIVRGTINPNGDGLELRCLGCKNYFSAPTRSTITYLKSQEFRCAAKDCNSK